MARPECGVRLQDRSQLVVASLDDCPLQRVAELLQKRYGIHSSPPKRHRGWPQ